MENPQKAKQPHVLVVPSLPSPRPYQSHAPVLQTLVLKRRCNGIPFFITHCGFNSVLEALCLGVPVVAVPQWTDQGTNAKFVEDVWGVGIRANLDDKGIVTRENVDKCLREVMDQGEKQEEIKKNVIKWKKLAKEAIDRGGSSDKNIDEFVAYLMGYLTS